MVASKFQLNKVRRLINTQGQPFEFEREELNDFNEPTGEVVSRGIQGLYHETSSFISKTSSEATTTRSKPSPMILALWGDAAQLSPADVLFHNGKKYTVGGINNIAEANVIADISIEEVQTDGQPIQDGHEQHVKRADPDGEQI